MGERETLGSADEGPRRTDGPEAPPETLELGSDEDAPDKPPRHLRCLVGAHHWEKRRSEDGSTYLTCTICGQDECHPPLFMGPDYHHR
jgi:hypothetical protein